jgi:hypothetical protein
LNDQDAAAAWLRDAEADIECAHVFATIARIGGEVTHRLCVRCECRRKL